MLESANPDRRWRLGFSIATIVFLIAVAMRLPSCYESFWIDELHSAWSVWGTLAEVAPRAAAGNQTPVYFWLLWIWKQCVGNSEWALRLPSALAVSLAAALTLLGLYHTRRSLLAATAAGLLLTVESNALFYGTELRPFAAVILLGTIACWLAMQPAARSVRMPTALIAVSIVAVVLQPTSIGVFGWLLAARFVFAHFGSARQRAMATQAMSARRHPFATVLALGVIFLGSGFLWLSGKVLWNAWRHRAQWQSMGEADSLLQLWRIWPWAALVLLPAVMMFAAGAFVRLTGQPRVDDDHRIPPAMPWWGLACVVFAAVFTFWFAAAIGIAPVFHRRYFVACLPLLVWIAGELLSQAIAQLTAVRGKAAANTIALLVAVAPIAALLIPQGTAGKLMKSDWQLVHRGEGWREAVTFLQLTYAPDTTVLLSPGLIETSRLLRGQDAETRRIAQWYLTYPLRGPYSWADVQAVDRVSSDRSQAFPIVIRGSRATADRWLARARHEHDRTPIRIRSFGNVHVIEKLASALPDP